MPQELHLTSPGISAINSAEQLQRRAYLYAEQFVQNIKCVLCSQEWEVFGLSTEAGHNCSVAFLALLPRYLKTFDAEEAEKT